VHLQAIDLDPTNATVLSNRSLSWMRLGQPDQALADARSCKELKPDWSKAWYREGSALRLLQACLIFLLFHGCYGDLRCLAFLDCLLLAEV
jgi:tetratricopeptide (TPR) repeat protein